MLLSARSSEWEDKGCLWFNKKSLTAQALFAWYGGSIVATSIRRFDNAFRSPYLIHRRRSAPLVVREEERNWLFEIRRLHGSLP